MSAFQANDESSILSARTTDEPFETSELFWRFVYAFNFIFFVYTNFK